MLSLSVLRSTLSTFFKYFPVRRTSGRQARCIFRFIWHFLTDAAGRNFRLNLREKLALTCSIFRPFKHCFSIIWQASVGHTFQNDPSWDFAANPKIAPWQLKKSPPEQKPESFTKEDYLSYLPSGKTFQYQFNLIHIMTGRNLFAEYLTEKFDHLLYVNSEREVLRQFRRSLKTAGKRLRQKHQNDNYPFTFDYVFPQELTASIYV